MWNSGKAGVSNGDVDRIHKSKYIQYNTIYKSLITYLFVCVCTCVKDNHHPQKELGISVSPCFTTASD
jgi:hypothetical protein